MVQNAEEFDENQIEPFLSVYLFHGYKNKKLRVNINIPMKTEQRQEMEMTHKHIEERQKIAHPGGYCEDNEDQKTVETWQNLMTEVLNQLATRFKPKVPVIKKCVLKINLIEKGVLGKTRWTEGVLQLPRLTGS